MNLAVIITLSVVLVGLIVLVIILLKLYQKNRRLSFTQFANDLNQRSKTFTLQPIDIKDLPMKQEKTLTSDDIYYCSRALIGQYDNPGKIISEKNHVLTETLINSKNKISYHYKIINLGRSKFIPLDTIELLMTKNNLYVYHPLEPEIVNINKIESQTIFWEQNRLLKNKKFFPGIGFQVNKQSYFLLFKTYPQALKFLVCLNTIIDLNKNLS